MRLSERFPAFAYREFRLYIGGAFLSQVGNQVQIWAIAWHVYHLTGSSLMVGLLGVARVVPLLVFSLIGGVVADQLDRRKIMLATQTFLSVIALCFAVFSFYRALSVGLIYVLVAIYGGARAFDTPARQSMIVTLVPESHFANAVSLYGITWRLSEVLGPVLTGFLLAWSGFGNFDGVTACYAFNFVSFFSIIYALLRLPPQHVLEDREKRVRSLKELAEQIIEGWRFVQRTKVVSSAMWIDFWATFFSSANALLPAFAGPILNLGKTGYGILASSSAVGALIAAGSMAYYPGVRKQGLWVIGAIGAYGLFTVAFAFSVNLVTAACFLAATGAADMVSTVLRQTIRQLATPNEMRGRMTAISQIFNISGPQLGDAEAGALAAAVGERWSIAIGGFACLLVSGHWLRSRGLQDYEHDYQVEGIVS